MLMKGKRGLIMGVANDHSIAWGIAKALHEQGAELAFTYQGDALRKRLHPLAQSIGSDILIPCDVSIDSNIEKAFNTLSQTWPTIDFIVHAIAYANKDELQGRFIDTTLEGFHTAMHISCYSFISVMRRAEKLMPNGGSALTLSYIGAQRVIPNYNVMGVAKAALEASTRYMAADLGPQKIRVNAISAGPMRTLAGAVIGSARDTYKKVADTAPMRKNPELEDVGGSALYLLSDLSKSVSGEVHFVDGGFHSMGITATREAE
jgi:enoyl-[acyl-carrier protein] reductase I